MTLQDKKEQLAKDKNTFFHVSPAHEYFRRGFISGFDEADPIGFGEFLVSRYASCVENNWREIGTTKVYTSEQVYLKFLEYKQNLKH